ncbi:MAG: UDP-N-acetylmuramate--L-alanine ligase [Defluviitaleaceae bacterium]|nr:UDP-N-acetylmuramate--L-alanine ligase [Defluviitaleaceae bacterium]
MKKYYLVGIKGAGMSALANVLHDMGHALAGSDIKEMLFTQIELEAKGIVLHPWGAKRIEPDMEVIVGNAFSDDHEDVCYAKAVGARVVRYHEFLGELASQFVSIAVSGTHGKTTTTGLLAHVLRLSQPTSYLIGDGTGKGVETSRYFVFEACEYRRHFLAYHPDYLIVTNIEHDHPDYFKDVDDVLSAFQGIADQCRKKVIMWGDDAQIKKLNVTNCLTYGFLDHNDVKAKNVMKETEGTTFDVIIEGQYYHTFKTPFFGDHMVLNSLSVIAVCYLEGMDPKAVGKDLSLFMGVKRRFSQREVGAQILIDDYAHHPTEIEVTLKAARQKFPTRPLIAIFQPHTFSRTTTFATQFADALKLADHVYLTEIFGSAREKASDIDIQMILDDHDAFKLLRLPEVGQLKQHEKGVLVFMGAGDIEKYEYAYMNML